MYHEDGKFAADGRHLTVGNMTHTADGQHLIVGNMTHTEDGSTPILEETSRMADIHFEIVPLLAWNAIGVIRELMGGRNALNDRKIGFPRSCVDLFLWKIPMYPCPSKRIVMHVGKKMLGIVS